MRIYLTLFLLFILAGCNAVNFETSAIGAKSFSAPQINENDESLITIANPQRATACEITETNNLSITEACVCTDPSCSVKVKGSPLYSGTATLKYKLRRGDSVSPVGTISLNILSVFNVNGSLELSNVATSSQSKKVSFASLALDEDVQKLEVCLSSSSTANCDVQGWLDVTTFANASGQNPVSWNAYHLKSGVHGASFTLTESCSTPVEYFLSTRLTNVSNEATTVKAPFTAWSPKCLTNLSLWLDSDDASTLTLIGSDVSEWRDKSMNANHAIQNLAASRPVLGTNILNGQNVVQFPSTADTMTGISGGTFQSIIAVRDLLGSSFQMLFASPAHGDFSVRTNGGFDGTSNVLYTGGPNSNDWTYNNNNFWVNGDQTTTGMTNYHIMAASSQSSRNSSYSVSADFMNRGLDNNSGVAELIVLSNEFSTLERQMLEGYLAHKWDLQSFLPANHPYKSVTP